MLSVVVIGAGSMGKTHMRAYQKMEHVNLAGIVDVRQPEFTSEEEKAIPFFNSIEEANLHLEQIDVVDICLPTFLHKEYVKKAAELGKHVICEKPLARTVEESNEMIEICKQHGVNLYVGHVVRFFPDYQEAKRVLDSGVIGNLKEVRATRNSTLPNAWNNWYTNRAISGGPVLDLMVHDFDFLRWCFGNVEQVTASSTVNHELEEERALVNLKFESGTISTVEGIWSKQGFYSTFELVGEDGYIKYDSRKSPALQVVTRNGDDNELKDQNHESPYYLELAHFLDCVEHQTVPIITPEDGAEAVKISIAALKSIETKQSVEID